MGAVGELTSELSLRLGHPLRAGTPLPVVVRWRNTGSAELVPPAFRLGWRLAREGAGEVGEGRWDLERPLAPGAQATARFAVPLPVEGGRLHLRVSPLEEGVRWFDDAAATVMFQV